MAATYNPENVTLTFSGAIIQEFAEGSFINIEFNADAVSLLVGADGKATRSVNPDKSARITIRLLPTSSSLAVFRAASAADAAGGLGALPLTISSPEVGALFFAEGAWVVKDPGVDFQVEAQAVEIILETDSLIGGITGL